MLTIASLMPPPRALAAADEHLDLPAAPLGVAQVHAQELGGEQRRLVAAGARPDLDDDVAVVVGVLGESRILSSSSSSSSALAQGAQLGSGHLPHLGVGVLEQRLVALDLAQRGPVDPEGVDERLQRRALLGGSLKAPLVGDDLRVPQIVGESLEAVLDLVELGEHFLVQHAQLIPQTPADSNLWYSGAPMTERLVIREARPWPTAAEAGSLATVVVEDGRIAEVSQPPGPARDLATGSSRPGGDS